MTTISNYKEGKTILLSNKRINPTISRKPNFKKKEDRFNRLKSLWAEFGSAYYSQSYLINSDNNHFLGSLEGISMNLLFHGAKIAARTEVRLVDGQGNSREYDPKRFFPKRFFKDCLKEARGLEISTIMIPYQEAPLRAGFSKIIGEDILDPLVLDDIAAYDIVAEAIARSQTTSQASKYNSGEALFEQPWVVDGDVDSFFEFKFHNPTIARLEAAAPLLRQFFDGLKEYKTEIAEAARYVACAQTLEENAEELLEAKGDNKLRATERITSSPTKIFKIANELYRTADEEIARTKIPVQGLEEFFPRDN